MADQVAPEVPAQITATVTQPLTGEPPAGLRIIADGATTDNPADWTKEYEATGSALDDRVLATVRTPTMPIVTGSVQEIA